MLLLGPLLKHLNTEICPPRPVLKIFSTMKEIREQEAKEPEYKPSKFTSKFRSKEFTKSEMGSFH